MLDRILQEEFFSFVIIHTEKNFENTVNHIIKFGRRLNMFVNGNNMNTTNELNSV